MGKRLAVVTGGSRGIGRAIVERLADDGHRVCAVARRRDALDTVARHPGGEVEWRVADVTDADAVKAALGGLRVDILVTSAGTASTAPARSIARSDWDAALMTNATAVLLTIQAVLPGMLERGWGRIVNIGSTVSHVGSPYTGAYAASKHAALGFLRVVASECAGKGVTANTVCPTFVETDMTDESIRRISVTTGRSAAEARASLETSSPLGRLLNPAEVAAAVSYLVSEDAGAINAQTIILDGGGIQR